MLELKAETAEQKIILEYLQSTASDTLTEKINNGVRIEKNSKPLINKKDLSTFMEYACEEAKKQAVENARFACINSDTVFGWAVHYFEEDSIIGKLYNEDGTEYRPIVNMPARVHIPTTPISVIPKKQTDQMSLFDMISDNPKEEAIDELETIEEEPPEDKDYEVDMETGEILRHNNAPETIKADSSKHSILQALFGTQLITRCV
jgi:hypothetical protein